MALTPAAAQVNPGGAQLTTGGGYLQPLMKPDRSVFLMSDDSVVHKQIESTHVPDGREVDVRPILRIVEDIFNRATPTIGATIMQETKDEAEVGEDRVFRQAGLANMLEALSYTIDRVACEIACKCMGGNDVHSTAINLLQLLANFSWDAKLVLTMAAFALNYGEFWLLTQIYTSNSLAKSMAILKKLPDVMEHSGQLKPRFDTLNNLIGAMLGVTRCIVEFKELPSTYISQDEPDLIALKNTLPMAVYWTIRAIVVCATQINSLTSLGHEYMATETWDLSTLSHKLNTIHENLRRQLASFYQFIEGKRAIEAYEMLKRLFEMSHLDNMKTLKALICPRDDIQPLVDGATKRRVNIEVLRRKSVLLLISSLDISQDELSILEQIYNESRTQALGRESHYEVVWIPIVDKSVAWSDPMQARFEELQNSMPWYTVHHPSLIDKAVIKFIREDWHFKNKPILVVLDPQGKVACPNAIHMMWIWGSTAFPFTSHREESLWREESWRLELLVNGIDPIIINWIREGKYIFVIGGDDIEWIRKFTNAARTVATAERIPLEMVYVGRSGKREQVRKTAEVIAAEKLCHSWSDPAMTWFFWIRLESMLFSKIQQGKVDEHDTMTKEIKKLLSFDKVGGWAVLSRGSAVLINGQWAPVLATLTEYNLWKELVATLGFDTAIQEHHRKLHDAELPCCRFEFPSSAGKIPPQLMCPECRRQMEKYITFLCCHDEPALGAIY